VTEGAREGAGQLLRQREVGIGLVGIGWMGRVHSQSYRRLGYHYPELRVRPRLVVASDISAERGRFAVEALGYERWTNHWEDVVADPSIEVVSITTPNYLHRDIALAAVAQGKHFWIEKPLGRSAVETFEIAQAAESAGVRTAVGFNYRHVPAVKRAKELIASGELGRLRHIRGVFLNDYAAEPRAALSWRFRRSLSGWGVLGDLMSHVVDLVQYLVGPIAEVSSLSATMIAERPLPRAEECTHFEVVKEGELAAVENEDYVGSLCRFANGAVGSLEASRVAVGPRCKIAFDVHGSEGAVSWDFERMNELRVCLGRAGLDHGYRTVFSGPGHGEYARFQPGPAIAMGYDDLKVVEAALLLGSVVSGRPGGAGVVEARAAAAVLAAMERASASGCWERVEHRG
jgi:predicted dehydrogenase